MKKLFLLSFSSMIIFGCAKKNIPAAKTESPTPKTVAVLAPGIEISTPAQPAAETATDEMKKVNKLMIENGQKVYESKCGKCHSLKIPGNYTQERWVKLVDWMAPNAQLTPEEKKQCLAYLQFNAKDASMK